MKTKLLIFNIFIVTSLFAQKTIMSFDSGLKFDSIFESFSPGEFTGTVNGVLLFKSEKSNEFILDFQGSSAKLFVENDPDTIYANNYLKYVGQTTSGKSKVRYTTYATAHSFSVEIGNKIYGFNLIDGCCCVIIDGLEFYYKLETKTEYLILKVIKELELRENFRSHTQKLILLPNSVIVFAIKNFKM